MPARYFTVEEANALLPQLKPLVADVLERRARVVRSRHLIRPILKDLHSNVGGNAASEMTKDFIIIEHLVKKIQAYGVILKDLNIGLLDFLSERDGREIYLCWRYGEPSIEHYHELHGGFNGRHPI